MERAARPLVVALAFLLLVLPAACGPGGGGSAPGSQPAGAGAASPARTGVAGAGSGEAPRAADPGRPLQPVQVAITAPGDMAWILYAIADLSGIAASEGIALELLSTGANISISAIASGEIPYTAQIGSVMRSAARGLDVRVVAVFMDAPLQSLIVRPEIRRPADLIGKSVAVSTAGATTHLATVAMVEAFGIQEQQVDWVFAGAQSARFATLEQGLVQGAAITPPLDIIAERDHGFPILVNASDVLKVPFVGIGTSTQRIRERPDEIKRLIRTLIRAQDFTRERTDEAVELAARWSEVQDRVVMRRSIDQVLRVLAPAAATNREGFQRELALIQKLGELRETPRPEAVVDFRLLEEVQREMGLPVGGLRD